MQTHLRGVRFIKMAFLLMIAVIAVAGCAERASTFKGDKVTQQNYMIPLKEGNQQGEWKTNEVAIKFQYQLTPGILRIDGTVGLVGGFDIGFSYINNFVVNLLFMDNQGNVVGSTLIYAGDNNLSIPIPMRFGGTIPMPGGAQQISFSYRGELSGDSTYSIWFSPP
jgi:hypothetical protein